MIIHDVKCNACGYEEEVMINPGTLPCCSICGKSTKVIFKDTPKVGGSRPYDALNKPIPDGKRIQVGWTKKGGPKA